MNIVNQKPVVLSPIYNDTIGNPFNPAELVKQVVARPLFTPQIQSSPVTMTDNNGNNVTEDDITDLIIRCCGEVMDASAEAACKTLLGQTLLHYNNKTNIPITNAFVIQSAVTAGPEIGCPTGMPEPDGNTVFYTPAGDVIPMCRQFMAGTASYDLFFASLAFCVASPETLGFYFVNEVAFTQFIAWFQNQMAMLGSVMPPTTNKLAADFANLTLKGLTESLILRNNDAEENDPNSFARLLIALLMQYTTIAGPGEFGVLPFNIAELICPKTVVFVNVEKHAHATARKVREEWDLINGCLQQKNQPHMISNKSLRKLTAVQRNLKKISSMAANAASNQNLQAMRAANFRFSKTRPTTVNMGRIIKKILDKMTFTNKSMNVYKSVKSSFAKPNRRDPDDYNKQGKVVSTRYKPDIHLYIDTSGSISERDYQDAVKACIAMAKKLNINMYFNSFSHIMSQTTRLHLEGKSNEAIYEEFKKVPKVNGGTDYEQIWHFINQDTSKKRQRELSIIISDFEWTARTATIRHPKNLYYIPCSTMNWDSIVRHAEAFCKSAVHNDPNIRAHVLF